MTNQNPIDQNTLV